MKSPKITMPKQTAELEKIFNTLSFYNKYDSWVDNDLYKEYISEMYPEKSDNSVVHRHEIIHHLLRSGMDGDVDQPEGFTWFGLKDKKDKENEDKSENK